MQPSPFPISHLYVVRQQPFPDLALDTSQKAIIRRLLLVVIVPEQSVSLPWEDARNPRVLVARTLDHQSQHKEDSAKMDGGYSPR